MVVKVEIQRRKGKIDLSKLEAAVKGRDKVAVGWMGAEAEKATVNEFGSPKGHVPERPALRNAMRDNLGKYRAALRDAARAVIRGEKTMEQALGELGPDAVKDIQNEIAAMATPPNSPETVRTKGADNPLVDDGALGKAVKHEVR